MLARTHIAFALFLVLIFFHSVENFYLFAFVFLLSSLLPDIDTPFSKIGKIKIFRLLNFFTKHRGIFHSFIFVISISILLIFFENSIWLAFLLGYSSHLILDSLTIQGVRLFYPFKIKIKGLVKTNGFFENFLFVFLVIINFFLIIKFFLISNKWIYI